MDPQLRLIDLGTAVADGTPVDWTSAASRAAGPAEQVVVRNLRLVERIAQVHVSVPPTDTGSLVDSLLHPSSAAASSAQTGTTWGPLTILEKIGRGTFGDVYRARDPRLDRPVALKLLRRREHEPDAMDAGVVEEGRLLARVRHPNVVTVFGAERIDGRAGLWMELVDGETLEAELRRRGPFESGEIVRVGIDLCRALDAVHRAGLLHRDLKAQNAMHDRDGRVLLMDFGAGRKLAELDGSAGYELAGTPLYLAPEVLDGRAASAASDVYSLGILLFHLATGSFPVRGRSLRDLRDAHARRTRDSLRSTRPDLPAALATVIDHAIDTDASRRYQRAPDLEGALSQLSPVDSDPVRTRRLGMIAAAAVVVVLTGVVVVPSLWRRAASTTANAIGGQSQGSAARPGMMPERAVSIRRLDVPNLDFTGELSSDGKFLPYTGSDDYGRLMLFDVVTGKTRALTVDAPRNDVSIESSVVSPDDSEVAYAWESSDCHCTEIRTVHTQGLGNPPRVLVRDESHSIRLFDWSRTGTEILALLSGKDFSHQIALVSTQDGTVRTVKTGLEYLVSMHLSPDGQYVAYDYPVSADNAARDIFLISTDGSSEAIPLVQSTFQDAYPIWTPDGRGVVFASDQSGTLGLWLVPVLAGRPQEAPRLVAKDVGRMRPLSVTRDGRLLYLLQSGAVDVYTARLAPDGTIDAGSAAQAAGSYLGSNMDPDWSPDGRSIVYVSRRRTMAPRQQALVVHSIDTGQDRALWPDLDGFIEPRWAPDGASILVRGGDRRGVSGAWRVDARTGSILSSFGWVVSIEWAPDGRSFFSVPVGSRFKRVDQTDVRSGRTREVYHASGGGAIGRVAVSPDGRSLALAIGEDGNVTIVVVPVSGSAVHAVARFTAADYFGALQQWTRDGQSILFTRRIQEPTVSDELWSVPASGGAPRSLNLTRDRIDYVRVSPEGEQIVFRTGRPYWDLWLMDNVLSRTNADGR